MSVTRSMVGDVFQDHVLDLEYTVGILHVTTAELFARHTLTGTLDPAESIM